jgi:hypothetical protein
MCRDETLLRGRVTVKAVDARSVVADLDLEFPSVHLRRMEAFGSATPTSGTSSPLKGRRNHPTWGRAVDIEGESARCPPRPTSHSC